MFYKEVRKDTSTLTSIGEPVLQFELEKAIMRAKRLRSLYVRDFVASMFKPVGRWFETYKTRARLASLSDRELSDMGLTRGDIDAVAFGHPPVTRGGSADLTAHVGASAGNNLQRAA